MRLGSTTCQSSSEERCARARAAPTTAPSLAQIGVPRAAVRDRPPQRVQQGVQHLPHMAQLADFMRYQVHAAIPAVAVHA